MLFTDTEVGKGDRGSSLAAMEGMGKRGGGRQQGLLDHPVPEGGTTRVSL